MSVARVSDGLPMPRGEDGRDSTRPGGRGRDEGGACRNEGKRAYPHDCAGTETGAAIEPVIIPQFVDLDPFATVGRL
jgi:hypothetical protein